MLSRADLFFHGRQRLIARQAHTYFDNAPKSSGDQGAALSRLTTLPHATRLQVINGAERLARIDGKVSPTESEKLELLRRALS